MNDLMHPLRPLLCRTKLLTNESLPSFLLRLAAVNAIEQPNLLYSLCLDRVPKPHLERFDAPKEQRVLDNISLISGIDRHNLYNATKNRFISKLASNGPCRLPRETLSSAFLSFIQYCPYCLGELPYHRLNWMLRLVAACPEHHCLLLRSCFHCDRVVSLVSVVTAQCAHCQVSLALSAIDRDQAVIRLESWFEHSVQSILQAILMEDDISSHIPEETKPFAISDLSSLFMLLNDIQSICLKRDDDWILECPLLSDIDIIEDRQNERNLRDVSLRYNTSFIAIKIFLDGPYGWERFLLHYQTQFDYKQPSKLSSSFDCIFDLYIPRWIDDNSLSSVCNATIAFLANHPLIPMSLEECTFLQQHSIHGHSFDLVSMDTIANELGIASPLFHKFVISWAFSYVHIGANFNFYMRRSLLPLIQELLDSPLTTPEIASILNSPIQITQAFRRHSKNTLSTAREALLWGTSLWKNIYPLQSQSPTDSLMALKDAAAVVPQQKYDFMGAILWFIQSGVIDGYAQNSYSELTQVYINTGALQTVFSILNKENANQKYHRIFAPVTRISISEISDRFGIPADAVYEWIHLGHLQSWSEGSGRSKNIFCAEDDIQQLVADPPGVTARELGWLWGIVSTQVVVWVEAGLLEHLIQGENLFPYPGWDWQSRMVQLASLQLPPPIHFTRLRNAICLKEICGWLSTEEIAQSLHIPNSTVYQAQLSNIIAPIASCRLFSYFAQSSLQSLFQALEQGFTITQKTSRRQR